MDEKKFELWLKKIANTQAEEISCSECFDRVSAFVDQELDGAPNSPEMRAVVLHLYECRACQDEYETLRELSLMDRSGRLPDLDELLKQIQ